MERDCLGWDVGYAVKEARFLSGDGHSSCLAFKKKKRKSQHWSRGPALGKRMRSHKLEARILQEETFLAVHYGLPQAQPYFPAC